MREHVLRGGRPCRRRQRRRLHVRGPELAAERRLRSSKALPPNPFPRSGDGVNVEITYDGGLTREILDKDEAEGFFIPDPVGKPQQFRLDRRVSATW